MVAKVLGFAAQVAPWAIVGSLGYAAAFMNPTVDPLPLPQPLTEPRDIFYDVASHDGERFWFVGNGGIVLEGSRNQEDWVRHSMSTPVNLQGVAVTSENTVVAVGNAGFVFTREQGQQKWTSQQLPVSERAGKMVNSAWLLGAVWVVGEMGAIFRSDDEGRTWQSLGLDKDVGLNDIDRDPDGTLWITGEFGELLHSKDNGENWHMQSFGAETLLSVAFADDGTGVFVGNSGTIYYRPDSQSDWVSVDPVTSEHLYDVGFNGERWIAVGNSGVLVVSADGENWQRLRPDGFGSGFHTRLHNSDHGTVIVGQSIGLLSDSAWNTWPVEEK